MDSEHDRKAVLDHELAKLESLLTSYSTYILACINTMYQQIQENAEGLTNPEDIIRECPFVAQFRTTMTDAATVIRNRCELPRLP